MASIPLSFIAFDAGTQIRAAINEAVVAEYAERMTEGVVFPAIVLFHDGNQHYLADGFHRFMAAKRNDFRDIDAEVQPGTREDALWFALGANKANGQRLTEADKKHALRLAVKAFPERSMRQLAEQVGCSSTYASRVRDEVQTSLQPVRRVVGSDGRSYPASQDARDETRDEAEQLLREGKSIADVRAATGIGRDAAQQIRRAVGAGVDKSKLAVQQRRDRIREMAAEGHSTRQMAVTLGVGEETCRAFVKAEGIDVPADRAIGKSKRHDANRIIDQMVSDAENLCADTDLIDFTQIDRAQLPAWIESLQKSRRALSAFIRRLEEEQKKHGEAA